MKKVYFWEKSNDYTTQEFVSFQPSDIKGS